MHKITILQMNGYGDRTRTQAEVVRLFQKKYPELPPISQGTVSKIEKQFRERGHVRQLKKYPPNKPSDDQKLDVQVYCCCSGNGASLRIKWGTFTHIISDTKE
ncbi:hypothetical protein NQ318_005143 [Aromia moschata]|uniref:DUF4817 domain-containing protein n=1 Tax=Aromia moschata TaxID=1265417 RepID=A0AAV8YAB1_9CUCU|nr:hypothetical protein NQ318_005143 [Aromia moschata]